MNPGEPKEGGAWRCVVCASTQRESAVLPQWCAAARQLPWPQPAKSAATLAARHEWFSQEECAPYPANVNCRSWARGTVRECRPAPCVRSNMLAAYYCAYPANSCSYAQRSQRSVCSVHSVRSRSLARGWGGGGAGSWLPCRCLACTQSGTVQYSTARMCDTWCPHATHVIHIAVHHALCSMHHLQIQSSPTTVNPLGVGGTFAIAGLFAIANSDIWQLLVRCGGGRHKIQH
jgi:hypothetical protein